MPSSFRLARADFDRMRGFSRIQGRLFSLSFGVIPGRASPGFACVVSRKAAADAVDRNRIKRRSRAVFQKAMRTARPARVFVVYAKKAAADASFAETQADLRDLLVRSEGV